MENQFQLPRSLLIYAIAVPLAFVLGFFLIAPESSLTWILIAMVLFIGAIPIMLKHHHALLIFGWGAYINAFFVPGQPPIWVAFAFASFGISLLQRIISGKITSPSTRSITLPLLFILAATAVTAYFRGGLGFRALGGSSYGSKHYMFIAGAIVGYFALIATPIPKHKARWLLGLFFLSSLTALCSNAAYALGPSFYFLFNLFPTDIIMNQVMADYGMNMSGLTRVVGLSFASLGVYCFLLMRFGLRGIFDFRRPWRLLAFGATIVAVLFGGFRSLLIWFVLMFALQLWWEKLLRTKIFGITMAICVIGGSVLLLNMSRMPLSVQRTFSFLPIEVDATARADAIASTEWRLEMWRVLVDEIPQYFWLGKGYSIDPMDLYLAQEGVRRGIANQSDPALVAGDYHSGPLSTIIPMGIWGVIGLLWLVGAGARALYRNYRYGDPDLRNINAFLLTFFISKFVMFVFIFGAFNSELYWFTGILGLSVSLNKGIRAKPRPQTAPLKHVAPAHSLIAQPV